MPTLADVDALWDNGVTYDAAEMRRTEAGLWLGDGSPLGVRGGIVRHGDQSLAVSVSGSDVVTVQPGVAVVPSNAVSNTGAYRVGLGAQASVGIDARNSTNPRIDLVVLRVLDPDLVPAHGANTGRVEIITGTPSSSPSAPALPSMAVELARLAVPKVAGGAVTVDSSYRSFAATLGGRMIVPTEARLPTSGWAKGDQAMALDTGAHYTWSDAGGWQKAGRTVPLTAANAGVASSSVAVIGTDTVTIHLNAQATAPWPAAYPLHGLAVEMRPRQTVPVWALDVGSGAQVPAILTAAGSLYCLGARASGTTTTACITYVAPAPA